MTERGYALPPGAGVSGDASLKASAASTRGTLTVIESDTDGGAPSHVHTREDEAMYVLEGAIVAHVGTQELRADAGGFLFLPRGIRHDWDVVGDRARVLIITVPGGFESFLAAFHAARDWAERDAIAAQYGLTFPRGAAQ
jgi:quercetin dioxygenase-like cupin family protein